MASKAPKSLPACRQGFTLIELVVSIAILLLLMAGLLASYNNYNQGQQLKQAAQTVTANLRLGQSKAISALKPASGCTEVQGYNVSFTAITYSIQARCTEGLVGTSTDLTLPVNVSFSPVPASFVYGVITRGLLNTNNSVSLVLVGFSRSYQLIVEPNGVITDVGFQ